MNTQNDYAIRRQNLMQQMQPESVAVIFAAPEILRNGDTHYPYRQNSDFYYLTGFKEPNAVAVLIPNRAEGSYVLFTQPRDPSREIWDGARVGPEGACKFLGANQAFTIDELDELLPQLLYHHKHLYCCFGRDAILEPRLGNCLNRIRAKYLPAGAAPTTLIDLATALHEMRLIKSETEIALMRTAAQISAAAHLRAMQICRPGLKEYQVEAEMRHVLLNGGCSELAYTSIVAAGKNACTLHYVDNAAELNSGDLLLVDVGGEHQYYAADITRTFPINGRFSTEQRAIYELVLKAQLAGIDAAQPGYSWIAAQEVMVPIITQGLINLGILQGSVAENIEKRSYQRFYMHNSGHWLGLDVHDSGAYKVADQWRMLQIGMVLTVEPGIYIAAESAGVDPRWWNIGVRIEDDILITAEGNEVLSAAAPKTVAEIEATMGK
ncbi:Xaa-Pro aminopeptidase [soil metagenome]